MRFGRDPEGTVGAIHFVFSPTMGSIETMEPRFPSGFTDRQRSLAPNPFGADRVSVGLVHDA